MNTPDLNDEQLLRYSRQIMLPEIDVTGQKALLSSRVLIIGIGGLWSPVALYLAACGVGHISIADPDTVELTNLQHQIAHTEHYINEIGSLQAIEAIKLLTQAGKLLVVRVLLFVAISMQWETMILASNPNCQVCGIINNL